MLPFECMPELSIEPGLLPDTAWASIETPAPPDVPAKVRTSVSEQASRVHSPVKVSSPAIPPRMCVMTG